MRVVTAAPATAYVAGMYNDQAGYDLQTDADPNKYQNDDGIRLLVAADATAAATPDTAAAAPDTAAADVAHAAVVCAACVGVVTLLWVLSEL